MRALAIFLVPLLTACGETEIVLEAPAVAPEQLDSGVVEDTTCHPQFGKTYVMDRLEVLPATEGLDLDGDGAADNALGILADAVNPGFVESIAVGNFLMLWDVTRWSEPPTPSDEDIRLASYFGIDLESPPVPGNNLNGQGEFLVKSGQFNTACEPATSLLSAALLDRKVTVQTPVFAMSLPSIGTFIELTDFRITFEFSDDFTRVSGTAGGVYTLCGLSLGHFPGSTRGTLLDFMVNAMAMQADIDRDGDGIERIVGDGTSIARCLDGDGTVIEGPGCACDSRIADGFSVSFAGTAVSATIVGVTEYQP